MRDPAKNARCTALREDLLPRLSDYVDLHADQRPDDLALVEYDTGAETTWKEFWVSTKAFAAKLLDMGLEKGDVVATTLPLLKEHVFLMYACFRVGVIVAPLDLRLKTREVRRCFAKIRPKAYFFVGKTEVVDFRPMVGTLMDEFADTCEHWIQFDPLPTGILTGATWVKHWGDDVEQCLVRALLTGSVKHATARVETRDPCLIVFTTGSTGFPKPALLCHQNVLVQNIGLKVAFDISARDRMCVNLPPSHVGCVTEQLATTIYAGGTSVILHVFDAEKTLAAIEQHAVTAFGQIPALFAMEWQHPHYAAYDLSSLRFALYGGQAVSREFLEQLATMAPQFGTGLGLTETAGFVTYTPLDGTVDDIVASVGYDSPLCPLSIRDPMKPDGSAGDEKPAGEVGEICFTGEQVFLGYLGDEAATRETISTDGFCYTGDLGYYDAQGLHFAGRSKFVIKPKGYQVFPTEVENFVQEELADRVNNVACVGVPHATFSEAIFAFVEPVEGQTVTPSDVARVTKELAAYKRPSHVVVLPPGEFPLNRVAKTDYVVLKERALEIVAELRAKGQWD